MTSFEKDARELAMEQMIGRALQAGVVISALVVLLGAALLLARHGGTLPDFHTFAGEPAMLRSVGGILRGVIGLDPYALVQFGLVLLIATPIVRVILTLVAFAAQRDWLYIIVTTIVLGILLWSIVGPS